LTSEKVIFQSILGKLSKIFCKTETWVTPATNCRCPKGEKGLTKEVFNDIFPFHFDFSKFVGLQSSISDYCGLLVLAHPDNELSGPPE